MKYLYKILLICAGINYLSSATASESAVLADSKPTDCRCLPTSPCWPTDRQWQELSKQLDGKLVKPELLTLACQTGINSQACKDELIKIKNPFYVQSKPGGTQTQGWLNAWSNTPSVYAVEAKTTKDIARAVDFAREHNLRIIVKGGGHDYLGRSSAPDSLLVWTHDMREVKYIPDFIPTGAPNFESAIPVITAEAGTRWIEAYNVATNQNHLYVQGGGCASVGAAGGFIQGGGFGSLSKKFGTGAAGIVQVEVVTADGQILIANKYQNSDLFWAIRGGGGGTYGIVSKVTLKLHQLPSSFGIYSAQISAKNDDSFKVLIKKFLDFYENKLNNEYWGEQFAFNSKNQLNIFMVYQGLNSNQANNVWKDFNSWIKQNKSNYTIKNKNIQVPPVDMWNYAYWKKYHPEMVTANTLPGALEGEYWWSSNTDEASQYIYTYQSWWMPEPLLTNEPNLVKLSAAFFKASRAGNVSVHINKGLSGASEEAIANSKETSTNPSVFNADALVLMGAGSDKIISGVKDYQPDYKAAQVKVDIISAAMKNLVDLAPNSGTYANEADYFQKNWQQDFWGDNYSRLLSVKQKYDPQGLFYCHHCVGSEFWNDKGMCRIK